MSRLLSNIGCSTSEKLATRAPRLAPVRPAACKHLAHFNGPQRLRLTVVKVTKKNQIPDDEVEDEYESGGLDDLDMDELTAALGGIEDELADLEFAYRGKKTMDEDILGINNPKPETTNPPEPQPGIIDEEGPDSKYPPIPDRRYPLSSLLLLAGHPKFARQAKDHYPDAMVFGVQDEAAKILDGDLFIHHPESGCALSEVLDMLLEGNVAGIMTHEEITDELLELVPETMPLFHIDDAEDVAASLGAAFYDHPSKRMTTIGICGTKGKSTVAWLVRGILEDLEQLTGLMDTVEFAIADDRLTDEGDIWITDEIDYSTLKEASSPFHITPYQGRYDTPTRSPRGLTIQKVLGGMHDRGATCAIMECDSVSLARGSHDYNDFNIAVFTNHMNGYMGDIAKQREAELSLMNHMMNSKKQAVVMNLDDPLSELILQRCQGLVPFLTYGIDNVHADVHAEDVKYSLWETEMIIKTPQGKLQIIMSMVGKHNVYNVLAAVATGIALRVPLQNIVAGIESVDVVPGRSEIIDEQQAFPVIVDAADTPEALQAMLQGLDEAGADRIFTVFGCRGEEDQRLRQRMGEVAHDHSDYVIITNDNPRNEQPDSIVRHIVSGFSDELLAEYSGWAHFPFQDPGHLPLWFVSFAHEAQRRTHRYVMEDRFSAIRCAIGTARSGDVVLIAGKGHTDFMEYGDGEEGKHILKGWFDDRVEVRQALSRLPNLTRVVSLPRDDLPWGGKRLIKEDKRQTAIRKAGQKGAPKTKAKSKRGAKAEESDDDDE